MSDPISNNGQSYSGPLAEHPLLLEAIACAAAKNRGWGAASIDPESNGLVEVSKTSDGILTPNEHMARWLRHRLRAAEQPVDRLAQSRQLALVRRSDGRTREPVEGVAEEDLIERPEFRQRPQGEECIRVLRLLNQAEEPTRSVADVAAIGQLRTIEGDPPPRSLYVFSHDDADLLAEASAEATERFRVTAALAGRASVFDNQVQRVDPESVRDRH